MNNLGYFHKGTRWNNLEHTLIRYSLCHCTGQVSSSLLDGSMVDLGKGEGDEDEKAWSEYIIITYCCGVFRR